MNIAAPESINTLFYGWFVGPFCLALFILRSRNASTSNAATNFSGTLLLSVLLNTAMRICAGSHLPATGVVNTLIDGTRLIAQRGMTGLTGNIIGLHEFQKMVRSFTRRPNDVFADVGAKLARIPF